MGSNPPNSSSMHVEKMTAIPPTLQILSLPEEILERIFCYVYPSHTRIRHIIHLGVARKALEKDPRGLKTATLRADLERARPHKVNEFMVSKRWFSIAVKIFTRSVLWPVDIPHRTGIIHAYATHLKWFWSHLKIEHIEGYLGVERLDIVVGPDFRSQMYRTGFNPTQVILGPKTIHQLPIYKKLVQMTQLKRLHFYHRAEIKGTPRAWLFFTSNVELIRQEVLKQIEVARPTSSTLPPRSPPLSTTTTDLQQPIYPGSAVYCRITHPQPHSALLYTRRELERLLDQQQLLASRKAPVLIAPTPAAAAAAAEVPGPSSDKVDPGVDELVVPPAKIPDPAVVRCLDDDDVDVDLDEDDDEDDDWMEVSSDTSDETVVPDDECRRSSMVSDLGRYARTLLGWREYHDRGGRLERAYPEVWDEFAV